MMKIADNIPDKDIAPDISCHFFSREVWSQTSVMLPREVPLTIYVNGQELMTILCTPTRIEYLVVGFLYSEGIITSLNDIVSLRLSEEDLIAEVCLTKTDYSVPLRRTRTPSGMSLGTQGQKVASDLVVTPQELMELMKQLRQQQKLFWHTGGTHCSALGSRTQIIVIAEDIGRHNTLDKILGECLMKGLPTQDHILLTTGRISSEMVLKVAQMQTPIIVSKGAPTERAVRLAYELNITVVGYTRESRLSVFSGEERLAVTNT